MAKCGRCGQRMFPRNKCVCNTISPGSSENKSRNDPTKWCGLCSSRVISGRCMNVQCQNNKK